MSIQAVARDLLGCICLGAALGGCSGIKQDTYEVQLTTDRTPHTVELWREGRRSTKLEYVYSLAFAQAYYPYRDNHCCLKQTTIGLLMDKASLSPWTEIVASQSGINEGLDYPRWKTSQLARAAIPPGNYDRRSVWVTIRGGPDSEVRRGDIKPTVLTAEHDIGEWSGFRSVSHKVPFTPTLPDISGYSTTGSLVWVKCLDGVKNCSFSRNWRGSTIEFVLNRKDAGEAVQISDRLVRFLEQHLVPRGTKP